MARKAAERERESVLLRLLYETVPGRMLLKVLASEKVSELCGRYMDSELSVWMIKGFIRKNHIRMSDYLQEDYRSFNEFFTRKIKPGLRPVCMKNCAFIAPCDGLLSAYRIEGDEVIPVKQSRYTISRLIGDEELAKDYRDGICLVFRLCVGHYHRYSYIDSGVKGENHFIPGVLHTVRPVALDNVSVFTENCREYTVMDTDNFGLVTQVEVGAMLVGKISNNDGAAVINRGEEKGMFLYGGSTVILLVGKDRVKIPEYVFEATKKGGEIPVRMGERIGTGISPQ